MSKQTQSSWPAWWPLSSSPEAFLRGDPARKGVFAFGALSFAAMMGLLALVSFQWPRWRWGMVLVLLALGAVPWLGVGFTRWRKQTDATAFTWLLAVWICVPFYLFGAPFLFADQNGRGGTALGAGLLGLLGLGLSFLTCALGVGQMKFRQAHTSASRRVFEVLLVATLGLLVVSSVKTWRGDVGDVFQSAHGHVDQHASLRLYETRQGCWVEAYGGVPIPRRCGGGMPRVGHTDTRDGRRFHSGLWSYLLFRERGAALHVDGWWVSPDGVEASSFLGAFPRAEYVIATWLVWLFSVATWVCVRRRMKDWRAFSMIEATVHESGLLTVDGRRMVTDRALPLGATVMVEDPKRLGASYRDDAVRSERVVIANEAQWASALTAAERHVWIALSLSLIIVGGILAIDLLLVW